MRDRDIELKKRLVREDISTDTFMDNIQIKEIEVAITTEEAYSRLSKIFNM